MESSNDEFFVLTPDFDRYLESYSRSEANVTDVLWANQDGSRPVGLAGNTQIYRFRAWPTDELLRQWYVTASERCQDADRRKGVRPAGGVAGGALAVPLGPGPLPAAGAPQVDARDAGGTAQGALLRPPGADGRAAQKWVSVATLTLSDGTKVRRGDPVATDANTQVGGRYGVQVAGDDSIQIYNLGADDPDDFHAAESEYDARLVPL